MARVLTWTCVAVLFATAVYSLVFALGPDGIGPAPGDGPPGDSVAGAAWFLGSLVGVALAVVSAMRAGLGPVFLLAPASAARVAAAFYTYDPYYAPTLRRYSDGGAATPHWIFTLLGIGVAAGVATRLSRRLGALLTPPALLLLLVAGALAADGH
jgi:hypothetical protein